MQTLVAEDYGALQRARETGRDEEYTRAQRAFDEVLGRSPRDVVGLVGLGTLAMSRHHFREALALEMIHRLRAGCKATVATYPERDTLP